MPIYTNTTFKGHYPVGTSAVIVARDRKEAVRLLERRLEKMLLKQTVSPDDLKLVSASRSQVIVLQDGEY